MVVHQSAIFSEQTKEITIFWVCKVKDEWSGILLKVQLKGEKRE